MRLITRSAIAALASVIVLAMVPRSVLAQQCRRTCEAGETRDVRGCCVPKAAPKPAKPPRKPAARPEPTPRKEAPATQAPEAKTPAARPSAPGNKPDEPRRVRRQRESGAAPARPAPSGAESRPAAAPALPPSSARPVPPKAVPEKPVTPPEPRPDQPPGLSTPANIRTESPVSSKTEPRVPSKPRTEPPDAYSDEPGLRPLLLKPDALASRPESEPGPTRRWPVWMPWAVVGTGVVVTVAGGVLYNQASNEYASFDKNFDQICGSGCTESDIPDLFEKLDRARTLETVSRISIITGGAVVIGGAALVFLNHTAEPGNERATARTFLVPTLGPHGAGIAARISF